jgi:uncharacterized repeat protein (TIGR03803 family)
LELFQDSCKKIYVHQISKQDLQKLDTFEGKPDGGGVFAGVAFDTSGNLYGTSSGGGAHGEGTAFELTPGSGKSWNESVLYSFCALYRCADGASPESTPVFDAAGNLYGTSNVTTFERRPVLVAGLST